MAARSGDYRNIALTQRQALHCPQQSATLPPLSQKHRSVSVALQPPPLAQRGERCQGATPDSPQVHPPPPCGADCGCTRGYRHLGGSPPPQRPLEPVRGHQTSTTLHLSSMNTKMLDKKERKEYTWLLIKLTPKDVLFSFLSVQVPYQAA